MKWRPYDANHAENYLNGCVLTLNGEPIYVCRAGRRRLRYVALDSETSRNLDHDRVEQISIEDNGLNDTPVPLGFVNLSSNLTERYGTGSFFAMRVPRRAWKVGLYDNNIVTYTAVGYRANRPRIITMANALRKTILGQYPSIEEVINELDKGLLDSLGVSRNFAIDRYSKVWYKAQNKCIGELADKKLVLYNDYDWLKQSLEKEGLM